MKHSARWLSAAGLSALAVLGANPAYAAGTTAGSTITNSVTVAFQVGGVAQTGTSASDTLTVDRTVNLTVAEVGTTTTTVSPGQSAAVTTFTVTNSSNAVLDFALAATQQVGGTGAHSNTDTFDVTNVKIYRDANANGTFESASDTLVTYLDELAADATATVFVVSDVPLALTTGSVAAVTLTATGREGGTSGSQGAALVQTTGGNTSGMDTVFADVAGATDAARDAAHSAKDDYTIYAAALTAVKTSKIISDPVNGTTNPKFIPGATIQYCIAISNASGSATATSVGITDPMPAQVTYDSTYGIKTNGSVDASSQCLTDGVGTGSFASNTVSGTLASVAAGETKTLLFRATIK